MAGDSPQPIFVGNFVGSFVDEAPDKVPDKVRSKGTTQTHRCYDGTT